MVADGRAEDSGSMRPAMSVTESLQTAFLLTLALAAMHALAPKVRTIGFIPERVATSFGGGFAVAFVFLHLLPGLIENRDTIGEIIGDTGEVTPLFNLTVFLVGLLGFNLVLALDLWARRGTASGDSDTTLFCAQLGMYALYNALITYTMPIRVEASAPFAIVFTLAMGFHFAINDRGMERHHAKLFAGQGRVVLIGALFAGWLLALVTEPDSVLIVAVLASFLGGSILMNVAKEEVPSDRDSSLGAFFCGEIVGALMLLGVTAMESGG